MRAGFAWICAASMLASCGQKAELAASDATIRLPAVPGRPGAAYFTLKGADQPLTLVSVTTPLAIRTELHESMSHDGKMQMKPIRDVPLGANGTLKFERGGKHVMLYDIAPDVRPGATVPLTLNFAEGRNLTVQAKTVGAGESWAR